MTFFSSLPFCSHFASDETAVSFTYLCFWRKELFCAPFYCNSAKVSSSEVISTHIRILDIDIWEQIAYLMSSSTSFSAILKRFFSLWFLLLVFLCLKTAGILQNTLNFILFYWSHYANIGLCLFGKYCSDLYTYL